MKTIFQFVLLGLVATAGALVTRGIHGPIQYAATCDPAKLDPIEVCVQTVVKDWRGEVLWVDARTKAEWEQGHVAHAVYLNPGDPAGFDNLVAAELERLSSAGRVVVYCGGSGCELSKEVARRLKALDFGNEVYALHGGWPVLATTEEILIEKGPLVETK